MRARLEAVAGSVPPITRGLIGTLISGYLIQLIFPAAKTHLGLVVGRFLVSPWTIVTSGLLVDSSIEARRGGWMSWAGAQGCVQRTPGSTPSPLSHP